MLLMGITWGYQDRCCWLLTNGIVRSLFVDRRVVVMRASLCGLAVAAVGNEWSTTVFKCGSVETFASQVNLHIWYSYAVFDDDTWYMSWEESMNYVTSIPCFIVKGSFFVVWFIKGFLLVISKSSLFPLIGLLMMRILYSFCSSD